MTPIQRARQAIEHHLGTARRLKSLCRGRTRDWVEFDAQCWAFEQAIHILQSIEAESDTDGEQDADTPQDTKLGPRWRVRRARLAAEAVNEALQEIDDEQGR